MNAIELIALKELRKELYQALERCSEKNKGRMEHEQIFIRGNISRALDVVKALEENSTAKS